MLKTSIIVPVYNSAKYLRECFDSIFRQTQKEIEVIAVNDGSTDNSLDILEEIKGEHPELIIISQDNQGPGAARNKGMEIAKGEFIYFIDSDDCLVDTAMDICYSYAHNNNLDLVMFDAEIFGDIEDRENIYDRKGEIIDKEKVLDGETFINKYWEKQFCPSPVLIYTSAELIKRNAIQFLPRVYFEDNEYYCKIMMSAKRVMYIPDALYKRRYRGASIMTSKFDLRRARDFLQVAEAIINLPRRTSISLAMHNLEIVLLNVFLIKCEMNDLLNDPKLKIDFWNTALQIYDGNIADIDSFQDINVLCQFIDKLHLEKVIPDEVLPIKNKRREVIRKFFGKIPFDEENKLIGIYGTGKYADRLFMEYKDNVGDIRAKLIFMDSYAESLTKKYKNQDVYNIEDIGDMPLDCILILSAKYEREMYDKVKKQYGDKFKIICLTNNI